MQYFNNIDDVDHTSLNRGKIEFTSFKCYLKRSTSKGLSSSGLIIRKDRLEKVGGYIEDSFAMDDNILLLRLGTEEPYIHIDSPITVGRRLHDNNYSYNSNAIFKGTIALIEAERNGKFPGGNRYKFDRLGSIGRNVISISTKYLKLENYKKIIVLLLKARLMVLYGLLHKFLSRSYRYKKYIIELKRDGLS